MFIIVLITGCSTTYYGHSKTEWDMLSKEEQTTIIEEYQFIIESKRKQEHKDIIDARTESVIELGVREQNY